MDTVPATIDALPHVVSAVSGRVPVLLDGGVRRGTDIFKALAVGATAINPVPRAMITQAVGEVIDLTRQGIAATI